MNYIDNSTAYKIDPLRDDDLRQAYERAAEHLTGKVIILRFSQPHARNAKGESYQDASGIYRVNIAPGVSVQESYSIMLHEAAHIRLHHTPQFTKRQEELLAIVAPYVDAREVNSRPDQKPQHDEAERLADHWYKLGEDAIAKSLRVGTTEKQRAFMNTNALLSTKWIGAK